LNFKVLGATNSKNTLQMLVFIENQYQQVININFS